LAIARSLLRQSNDLKIARSLTEKKRVDKIPHRKRRELTRSLTGKEES